MDSPVFCEIDLAANGKHQGHLRIPHSVHRSAYGWIPVPIVSIKNGKGPVVLLMAGNHGDEYEGQVALARLCRTLTADQISGQVIILPAANAPAAMAGLRTSPIDHGNLNRSFPGNPNGGPTEVIAHFIESKLLAKADYLLDIHSGGSSLEYRPTLLMPKVEDQESHIKNVALLKALGFTKAILYPESVSANFSSSAARRQGALPITAEMAGGGSVNCDALSILDKAIYRYLDHIGISSRNLDRAQVTSTDFYEIPGQDYYVYALCEGVFEPLVNIDDCVKKDDLVARIHFPDTPWRLPEDIHCEVAATVICKRVPARVICGDCLFELAVATSVK